jgi:hypothetical protein
MKQKMKTLSILMVLGIFFAITFPAMVSFAQEAAIVLTGDPAIPAVVVEPSMSEIIQGLVKAFSDFKALGWQAGLAALIMVLISSMKNTLLRQWLWSKIPDWAKMLMAPFLSLIAFGLAMGKDFSGAAFWAAITTGIAAVYMHELLDGLKSAPFIGEKWRWLVDVLGNLFGKKLSAEEKALKAAKEAAGKAA